MEIRTTGYAPLLAATLWLLLPLPTAAQTAEADAESTPAAIERLLAPSPSPWLPGARRMLEMLAELPLRKAFKGLDPSPDWGPDDPRWPRLLPEFRAGYLGLVAPDEASLRALLATRLAATLEARDIVQLADARRAPELEQLLAQASRLGLDLGLALRTSDLAAAPELHSSAEIAQIRAGLAKMQGQDHELQALLGRLQAIAGKFAGPAFSRYQTIMLETLQPMAGAQIEDPGFRQRYAAWLAGWQERLQRGR